MSRSRMAAREASVGREMNVLCWRRVNSGGVKVETLATAAAVADTSLFAPTGFVAVAAEGGAVFVIGMGSVLVSCSAALVTRGMVTAVGAATAASSGFCSGSGSVLATAAATSAAKASASFSLLTSGAAFVVEEKLFGSDGVTGAGVATSATAATGSVCGAGAELAMAAATSSAKSLAFFSAAASGPAAVLVTGGGLSACSGFDAVSLSTDAATAAGIEGVSFG